GTRKTPARSPARRRGATVARHPDGGARDVQHGVHDRVLVLAGERRLDARAKHPRGRHAHVRGGLFDATAQVGGHAEGLAGHAVVLRPASSSSSARSTAPGLAPPLRSISAWYSRAASATARSNGSSARAAISSAAALSISWSNIREPVAAPWSTSSR